MNNISVNFRLLFIQRHEGKKGENVTRHTVRSLFRSSSVSDASMTMLAEHAWGLDTLSQKKTPHTPIQTHHIHKLIIDIDHQALLLESAPVSTLLASSHCPHNRANWTVCFNVEDEHQGTVIFQFTRASARRWKMCTVKDLHGCSGHIMEHIRRRSTVHGGRLGVQTYQVEGGREGGKMQSGVYSDGNCDMGQDL